MSRRAAAAARLLAVIGLVAGCGAAPAEIRTVERVVTVPQHVRCASTPPPAPTPVPRPRCTRDGCTYSLSDAAALVANIEALQTWVRATWSLCAPQKEAP